MPPRQPEIIIESKISNVGKALNMAEDMANVRGLIGYSIKQVEDNKWKVTLTRGELSNLLKAVKKTPFLKLVEDESESIDVDLSGL